MTASPRRRLAATLALVVGVPLAASCKSGPAPATGDRTTPASTYPTAASSTPLPTQSELSFDDASQNGLVRDTALTITGPTSLRATAGHATITITISLPPHERARAIVLDWSGDCLLPDRRSPAVPLAAGSRSAIVSIRVTMPAARDHCDVRAEAKIPAKPQTGDGLSTSVNR